MPDVQEVFRMATKKVSPDPGALERQHRNQRWLVAKQKAGVYALVAGLVIAGVFFGISSLRESEKLSRTPGTVPGSAPAPEGLPPTADRLAGIWLRDDDILLVRFSPDGTYAFDNRGLLDTNPAAAGTYGVEGRIISFTNGRSPACPEGDRWAWRAGLTEDGRLHVLHLNKAEVIDDVNDDCDEAGEWTLTRVSPSSQASTRITADVPADPGGPPSTESALRGIWLLEGGGRLIRFDIERNYAVDDQGALGSDPADVGTFEVDGRGGVTLTSGANSRTCAEGDLWVWEKVRLAGGTLRGVVSENACPNDVGVELIWVRLSP